MRATLTFKDIMINVVSPLLSRKLKDFLKLLIRAYHRSGPGAKVADMERMLRGVTKGILTDVAADAKDKLR